MDTPLSYSSWLKNEKRTKFIGAFLLAANILLLAVWLIKTPPGLLGKADAAGYAVCHRIESHSFLLGDRQIPLCARCSGMYLGALLGMIYLTCYPKKAGMPSIKVSVILGLFLAAFAIDGVNSYLHFIPAMPSLYEPSNALRLFTGTGVGLGIAAILVPVLNQAAWKDFNPQAALRGWRDFLPLLGLALVLDLAILSDNSLILYPLALLSAFSILLVLTTVYLIVWLMITKSENLFTRRTELALPALAGFLIALLQIATLDSIRFWLTGTWAGFQF